MVALNLANGSLAWELDTLPGIATAAAAAGLPPPQHASVVHWLLDGVSTVFVAVSAQHCNTSSSGNTSRCDMGDVLGGKAADVLPYVGWVVAVDLPSGALLWASGPLQHSVQSMTLSEPALLATSAPDAGGGTWLSGIDRVRIYTCGFCGSRLVLHALRCHSTHAGVAACCFVWFDYFIHFTSDVVSPHIPPPSPRHAQC